CVLREGKSIDDFTLWLESDFAFSPDGKTLTLSDARDEFGICILRRDLTGQRGPQRLPNWQWTVASLAFTPDGKKLIVACGGALRVLDATTGVGVKWILLFGSPDVNSPVFAISQDGKLIAAPDAWKDKINLWRLEDVPPKAK